eukprot:77450-Lingulodinium_polyedra.AAC.1
MRACAPRAAAGRSTARPPPQHSLCRRRHAAPHTRTRTRAVAVTAVAAAFFCSLLKRIFQPSAVIALTGYQP